MRFLSCISLLTCLALLGQPSVASAAPIWSWEFDVTHHTVDADDSIVLSATLFNSALSTEPITTSGGASFTGDLQQIYSFTFGSTGNSSEFSNQFIGMSVEPGESFSFVLGILTPIGGHAPPGTHPFCCQASLTFGTAAGLTEEPPSNTFVVEVSEVSEPPSILLLALAAAVLTINRYRGLAVYLNTR
jgi:hypothetical protein